MVACPTDSGREPGRFRWSWAPGVAFLCSPLLSASVRWRHAPRYPGSKSEGRWSQSSARSPDQNAREARHPVAASHPFVPQRPERHGQSETTRDGSTPAPRHLFMVTYWARHVGHAASAVLRASSFSSRSCTLWPSPRSLLSPPRMREASTLLRRSYPEQPGRRSTSGRGRLRAPSPGSSAPACPPLNDETILHPSSADAHCAPPTASEIPRCAPKAPRPGPQYLCRGAGKDLRRGVKVPRTAPPRSRHTSSRPRCER